MKIEIFTINGENIEEHETFDWSEDGTARKQYHLKLLMYNTEQQYFDLILDDAFKYK